MPLLTPMPPLGLVKLPQAKHVLTQRNQLRDINVGGFPVLVPRMYSFFHLIEIQFLLLSWARLHEIWSRIWMLYFWNGETFYINAP